MTRVIVTRAQEAMRVVAQLRAALYDMTWCDFEITSGREAAVNSLNAGPSRHRITIDIVIADPDEPAP
jgi:hypothetical protein